MTKAAINLKVSVRNGKYLARTSRSQNPKHEIRNNTKLQHTKLKPFLNIGVWQFEFV